MTNTIQVYTISKGHFPIYRYTSDRVSIFINELNICQKKLASLPRFGDVCIKEFCESKDCSGNSFRHVVDTLTDTKSSDLETESSDLDKDTDALELTVSLVHGNKLLQKLSNELQGSKCVAVIDNNDKTEDVDDNIAFKKSMIVFSSSDTIKKDIDLLLERYAIRYLREAIDEAELFLNDHGPYTENYMKDSESTDRMINGSQSNKRSCDVSENGTVRSGKRFRSSTENDIPDKQELYTLLLDAVAFIERSSVPVLERPSMKCREPCVLDKQVAAEIFKTDPHIDGCGFQHHLLHIYLNRQKDCYFDEALRSCLKLNNINDFRFHFGPCKLTPMCGIKVGQQLARHGRFATLGGFAANGPHQYALTARHYVQTLSDNFLYCTLANGSSEGFAIIQKRTSSSGELDIAAAQMLPIANNDFRFKRSSGNFTHSSLFKFQAENQHESEENEAKITGMLRGEQIFSWTANSLERPKVGRIYIPLYHQPNLQYKYIIIRNLVNNNDTFGHAGDSGAIICRDERDSNGVNVISMFMGQRGGTEEYMTLPLQQGLQQLSTELHGNFQIC